MTIDLMLIPAALLISFIGMMTYGLYTILKEVFKNEDKK
jgi:nitrogen fixation-related uncharacterized protein